MLAVLPAAAVAGAGGGGRDALDRALERIVAARGPPGPSVLIQRGAAREVRRRGFADVRTRRRPAPTDHMRLASLAKAYNGAVALSLASTGELSLDDTVGARLPGVLPLAGAVTLSQTPQHTAGMPDYVRSPALLERFMRDPAGYLSPVICSATSATSPCCSRPGRVTSTRTPTTSSRA